MGPYVGISNKIGVSMQEFRSRLLDWGSENIASYPWRYEEDPYLVLASEFMLHRTQSRQAERVYTEFVSKYPNLESLVAARTNGS